MDKAMFDELLESVQQMDEIAKGKKTASRSFDFPGELGARATSSNWPSTVIIEDCRS